MTPPPSSDDSEAGDSSGPGDARTVRAHGAEIPILGLGTWQLEGRTARAVTEAALEMGYRHVDTARAYGNEREVGQALEESAVDRDEVFLTTKIWPDDYARKQFRAAVEDSLERLGTDQVDLLLLHWPNFEHAPLEETLEELARAREHGQARHVGVCNFNSRLLRRARRTADIPLVTDQVEYHPYLRQDALLDTVRNEGMALTAYSPLAQGSIPAERSDRGTLHRLRWWAKRLKRGRLPWTDPLEAAAERHGKTVAQVTLRWVIQQEAVCAIPRTSDPDHLRENLEVFDFELSAGEMDAISGLSLPDGRVLDPAGLAPDWD